MITFLQNLFRRRIEDEIREPFVTVPVPGIGKLGIAASHPIFWAQLFTAVTIQSIFNFFIGVAIYYLVLKNRGSIQSYLIGYGVILPSLTVVPFQISQYLGLHNNAMMVGLAASTCVVFFRCLMAIHATLPYYAEKDFQSLVLFFVSPVQFTFDIKTGQVTRSTPDKFRKTLFKTIQTNAMFTLVLNIMILNDYELFVRKEVKTFLDLFYWRNILNNYAMAYLVGTGLAGGSMMVGTAIEFVSGNRVIELADSPLTKSSSISEFWGKRWNLLVHIVLKGGVYIPLRNNGFPIAVAGLATFAASGVLHEYVLLAIAMKDVMEENHSAYKPRYGYHLAFFAWNGFVMGLEGLFYKHPLVQEMKRRLPAPAITFLVIMSVLPIGHWFTDEYADIGFFRDYAVGMPLLIWTPFRWETQ